MPACGRGGRGHERQVYDQLNELYASVGKLESGRIGVKLTAGSCRKLKDKLAQEPDEIGGRKVEDDKPDRRREILIRRMEAGC